MSNCGFVLHTVTATQNSSMYDRLGSCVQNQHYLCSSIRGDEVPSSLVTVREKDG